MKRLNLIFILILIINLAVSAQEPAARIAPTLTTIENSVYLFGGNGDAQYFNDLWEFSWDSLTESGTWTELNPGGDIPPARSEHTAINYENSLYILGGITAENVNDADQVIDLYQYSPATNQWTEIEFDTTNCPKRMNSHAMEVIGDKLYVSFRDQFWSFDLNNFIWQELQSPPQYDAGMWNFQWHNTAVYENKFFVTRGGGEMNGMVYVYDSDNDSWSTLTPNQQVLSKPNQTKEEEVFSPVWGAAAFSDGQYHYNIGGRRAADRVIIGNCYYYDLMSNIWQVMNCSIIRYHGAAAKIPNTGKAILVGGKNSNEVIVWEPEIFEPEPLQAQYQLTTTINPTHAADDGCKVDPSQGNYNYGTLVNIEETAAEGWVFDKWTGDASGTDARVDVIMNRNKNVVANFQPILMMSMNSPDPDNLCPPGGQPDTIEIATVNVFVDGVDWQLNGLTFTATGNAKNRYTEAYLEVNGKYYQGTIYEDDQGLINNIQFALDELIQEGTTLSLKFKYRIVIPYESENFKYAEALDEIKTLAVSTNVGDLNCLPVPVSARPGSKTPLTEFVSNTQTMANIWNISTDPEIPFITLHDAIADERTQNGHTIKLCPGYYHYEQAVLINKELHIYGSGYDKTFLEGKTSSFLSLDSDNIQIYGCSIENLFPENINWGSVFSFSPDIKNISIHNNKIFFQMNHFGDEKKHIVANSVDKLYIQYNQLVLRENGQNVAIQLYECNQVYLENNSFDLFDKGISTENCSTVSIRNNHFLNVNSGININKSHNFDLISNQFSTIEKPKYDINVLESETCNIKNNFSGDEELKIFASKLNFATISANTVINPEKNIKLNLHELKNSTITDHENLDLFIGDFCDEVTIQSNQCKEIYCQFFKNSTIKNNQIEDCKEYALCLYACKNVKVLSNQFKYIDKHGVEIIDCEEIEVKNNHFEEIKKSAIQVKNCRSELTWFKLNQNTIHHKPEAVAVLIFDVKGFVELYGNKILNANNGIYAFQLGSGKFTFNHLENNGTAIKTSSCGNIKISKNKVVNSYEVFTGINLSQTESDISENHFLQNNGTAVGLFDDSKTSIKNNNFIDNSQFDLYCDASIGEINCDSNYWGSSNGPLESKLSGNIAYSYWLDDGLSLVCDATEDTVQAVAGTNDSIEVFLNDFSGQITQVELVFQDDLGWITIEDSVSLSLNDTSFASYMLTYQIPEASESFSNKVMIFASSAEKTAIDSIYLLNYEPILASISIYPDSLTMLTGDTLQFSISPLDQNGNPFEGETDLIWSVSEGEMDSSGVFIAAEENGVVEIEVLDSVSRFSAITHISIVEDTSALDSLKINPDTITIAPGQYCQFSVSGFDVNGFSYPVECVWSASEGSIDSSGLYLTPEAAGTYLIQAQHLGSGLDV